MSLLKSTIFIIHALSTRIYPRKQNWSFIRLAQVILPPSMSENIAVLTKTHDSS